MSAPHVPEIGLPPGPQRDRLMALRALRNCVVIRVQIGKVPPGFVILQKEGSMRATSVCGIDDLPAGHRGFADCRLTDAGLDRARKELKPCIPN